MYDTYIGRAQSLSEISEKGEQNMSKIPVRCDKCNKEITVEVIEDTPVCCGGDSYTITCSCGGNAGTVTSKQILRVTGGTATRENPLY